MQRFEESNAAFRTTRPTLLDGLHTGDDAARRGALDQLIRIYWPPVYAYLRRSGRGRDESAELTQAFFADVALRRDLFGRAAAERGKMRTLIIGALKHYLIDVLRRQRARGGPALPIADLEREERVVPDAATVPPDEAFDRRWALVVLEEAMARCREHFHATGKVGHWSVFEARVLAPSISNITPPPLAQLSASHGFRTPADAAAAVQVVKKRAAALLREVAGESACGPQDQDDEHRLVVAMLS
ncbi:MAG: RNA polymerase sigma factor [Phycisphaerales bacterium]